ncbi:MAG: glycoside hydrolase domain-containing protein, partial [Synechococcaceae cyanobacterium]|nr:glycoside hydrolase domain-containing protein [Synechococcaceae cyanobacterium]
MPKGYKPRIRGGRAQGFADCFDDGLEMVARPMGKNVSDQNHRTDFKFNISCLGYGGTYTRCVVGQLMKNWEPDFDTAVRVTEDGTAPQGGRWWEMEVAFDLEDFELIADNRAGDQWRFMFGLNHLPAAGWMQERIPSIGGYFTADGKTLLTLVEDAPVARLTMESVPNVASDGTAAMTVAVSNPSGDAQQIAVEIDVADRIKRTETLVVPAGGTQEFVLDEALPEDVEQGALTVSVTHGEQTLLFYKTFFTVGRYNGRLQPPPAPDPNAFPFSVNFGPLNKRLHVKGDSYGLPNPDAVRHLEFTIAPRDGGRPIHKGKLDTPITWYYEDVLELPDIQPGEYEVTGHFVLQDGTRLGPRSGSFKKLDEAEAFAEWWGKDTGRSERVVPPFAALRAAQVSGVSVQVSGTSPDTRNPKPETYAGFSCLGREYAFNALGLPLAVESRGAAVLAAPARLVVTVDGKETVVPIGEATITDQKDWRVRFKGEATAAGVAFSAEGWMEQDGMVSVWLTYGPEAGESVTIDALRIEYPVANDVAECLLSVGPG